MRRVISGICNSHGYYQGEDCPNCVPDNLNDYFYTSKDKLWEFTSVHVTGRPTEIRTKRQWRKFLKENNKHDDTSRNDMDTIRRNHDRDLKIASKRNIHNAVEEAYRWAKNR